MQLRLLSSIKPHDAFVIGGAIYHGRLGNRNHDISCIFLLIHFPFTATSSTTLASLYSFILVGFFAFLVDKDFLNQVINSLEKDSV
jgi:hypothetical protein